MKRRLVIVGAGGFGREVHSWVNTSPEWIAKTEIASIVFVDDRLPQIPVHAPVISTLQDYVPDATDLVVCAIGSPVVRRKVVEMLNAKNAQIVSFVHDRAIVGHNVVMGVGVVVCPNALLSSDVRIGEHVHINTGCAIGHDVVVGDFVTLSGGCQLTGNVSVESDVFLSVAVSVIPGKRIGAGSLVGAGSVVLKDVPVGVTVFGNPSVIIGKRPE